MSQTSGKKAFYIANPVTGWAQMPYNTKEVLTESGEWVSPITGWIKVTCIGGGAAGASMATSNGSAMYSVQESTGGVTSFGDITSRGGLSFGGTAAGSSATSIGGCAGEVKIEYMKVELGDSISYSVGAGGIATGNFKSIDSENFCKDYPGGGWGGVIVASSPRLLAGSTGGNNGTPFGGGGGSASGATGGAGSYPGVGASGGTNGAGGQLTTSHKVNLGGNGGNGAIILEYADPKKKA